MKTKILATLAVLSLLGIAILGLRHIKNLDNQIQLKQIQLKDNSARLKLLDSKYIELNKELEAKDVDKAKVEEQLKQLQIERDKLQADLQAKREQKAKDLAVRASQAVGAPQVAYAQSGNKELWLSQSGIPQNLWGYVDWIVSKESGWKPCAYYPGGNNCSANPSTACGLVQQYPCHKIPGDWRDPVLALRWQYNYVTVKFGGYPQAVAYWQAHGNY